MQWSPFDIKPKSSTRILYLYSSKATKAIHYSIIFESSGSHNNPLLRCILQDCIIYINNTTLWNTSKKKIVVRTARLEYYKITIEHCTVTSDDSTNSHCHTRTLYIQLNYVSKNHVTVQEENHLWYLRRYTIQLPAIHVQYIQHITLHSEAFQDCPTHAIHGCIPFSLN